MNKTNNLHHLGIILDGNRTWAREKGLPDFEGHRQWAKTVEKVVDWVNERAIECLTLWALSKDNLQKRDEKEVNEIIKLIDSIESRLTKAIKNNIIFDTIWDLEALPDKSQKVLANLRNKTANNTWNKLILALNYWWQDEIVRATKKIIESWIDPKTLTIEEFRKYLDTGKLPPVDMIIRTWWHKRHSWFLLFEWEYTEYYFSDKNWPDFDEAELDKAIEAFNNSKRKFWK